MTKIALYCCYYGDYRDELKNGLETFTIDPKIDCFFYTDRKDVVSDRWKIQTCNIKEDAEVMDQYRHMAKKTKFIPPKELEEYDILIYIDCKYLRRRRVSIHSIQRKPLPSYDEILKNIENYDVLFEKHPWRTQAKEEIDCTIQKNLENKKEVMDYYNNRKNKTHSVDLIDTGYIIRRQNERTNHLMRTVYEQLLQYNLKRDQNVFNYVLDDIDFPKERLSLSL